MAIASAWRLRARAQSRNDLHMHRFFVGIEGRKSGRDPFKRSAG
jgi:hypothetical protein